MGGKYTVVLKGVSGTFYDLLLPIPSPPDLSKTGQLLPIYHQ